MKLSNDIVNIFKSKRKCIINADLDGLLSGMILQEFLEWDIVGFSSCSGNRNDELWLFNPEEDLEKCVFVDLPVYDEKYSTIDNHFVAFDKEMIKKYNNDSNKINPNIIREKIFEGEKGENQYTNKYPFGTIHFVIAILENLGIIKESYSFNFEKKLDGFDLADLILRADRVIGNAALYTENCYDWLLWLIDLGGSNTKILFEKVVRELFTRKMLERKVEDKLSNFGCTKSDGDCSKLLRDKNYKMLNKYFDYLAQAFEMKPIKLETINDFQKLTGSKEDVPDKNLNALKEKVIKKNLFSFAFISKKQLSMTYIEGVDDDE